jgi:hypothetical protein
MYLDIAMALSIDNRWNVLHTIPLFQNRKLQRRRLLDGAPTPNMIWQWIKMHPVAVCPDDPDPAAARTSSKWNGLSVNNVIKFVKASKHVKNQGDFQEARQACRELEDSLLDVRGARAHSTYEWNYESLRRARVTLDATCCLCFQEFWKTLRWDNCYIYVWIDANPQWKGQELFAGSFDLIIRAMGHFSTTAVPTNQCF